MGFELGRDATLSELRARHDAVLLATGVYKARDLNTPGAGSQGTIAALDFLTAQNRFDLGDARPPSELHAKDKRVVVIGGGDTAMDCVRTAVRQGARSVTCLYRRDRANMPGSDREVSHAEEEGVTFEWLALPKAVLGSAQAVEGVRAARMRLGAPDASGRQTPQEIPGGDFDLPADLVITALGFEPVDVVTAYGAQGLALNRHGAVKTDPSTLATNLDGVFAAGDLARGASLVVWAVRDGMDAAEGVHRYLKSRTAANADPVAAE